MLTQEAGLDLPRVRAISETLSPLRTTAATGCEAVACALILWLLGVYAISLATLTLGFGVWRHAASVALIVLPVSTWMVCQGEGRRALVPAALTAAAAFGVIAGGYLFAADAFDHSWDGASYQQQAIIHMVEGWSGYPSLAPDATRYAEWIDYYAKGIWVIAASIYQATSSLESAMLIHTVLAVSALLLLTAGLLRCSALPAWIAPLLGLAAALNPVTLYQSLSFYVDGQIASLLVAIAGLGVLLLAAPRRHQLMVLVALLVLSINIKHTGFAFAGLLTIALLIAVYRHRRVWFGRVFLAAAIGGLLGGLVFGYSPYVTNATRYGHPFYPILGNGDFDIASGQRPPGFDERNRLSRLAISTFSAPTIPIQAVPELRVPYTFSADELARYRGADIRLGGWGSLFSGSLVLGAILLLFTWRVPGAARTFGVGLIAMVVVSTLINPEAWWARYNPQWYFLPVIVAGMLAFAHARWARAGGVLLVAVLLANSVLVAHTYFPIQKKQSDFVRTYLAELKATNLPIAVNFGAFPSNRVRLREAGIEFREVAQTSQLPCASPQRIFAHQGWFCLLDR